MNSEDQVYKRFLDLKSYVAWNAEDDLCSDQLVELLEDYTPNVLEDFYSEIKRHPATIRVISGGEAQITRLKKSLANWLSDMFRSRHDQDYVLLRWKVGYRHVEVGLDQLYVNAAFARIRSMLNTRLCRTPGISMEDRVRLHASLNKRLDLDLAIMVDAYQTEYQSRQIPVDHGRLQQQKLLAMLSQQALAGAELNRIHDQAVSYLSEAFKADRCEFWQLDEESSQLRLNSARGWPLEQIGQFLSEDQAQPIIQYVNQEKGYVWIEDWQIQPPFSPPDEIISSRIVSSLFVSVRGENTPCGILGVHFQARRNMLSSDYDFLISIANLLATAVYRKKVESQRLENVNQLRRLVDRLPAGAVYLKDGTLQINQTVELMTGYSQAELDSLDRWAEIVTEEQQIAPPGLEQHANDFGGHIVQSDLKIQRADQKERLISQLKFQSGSGEEVWLLHDVTEERERRNKQLQSERLAAIGQMITGLAHESRNALQRIQACTEMLELHLETNESALQLLNRSQRAQDDLQTLFDEVRNYASPLALDMRRGPLFSLIEEAWNQIEGNRSDKKADLQLDIQVDVVQVDRFRFVQVFRNFFENSLAACEEPVQISVEARQIQKNDTEWINLTIADNGPGLPPEVAAQIFEPFFTTKSKGSGLGMAIATRIVNAHGGELSVLPSSDQGARFQILLPQSSPNHSTNSVTQAN